MDINYGFKAKDIIEQGRVPLETIICIKTWLPTMDLPLLPDESIILFLLSCDNDVTLSKHTIQVYFKVKNENSEIFGDCDIDNEELSKITDVLHVCNIPVRINDNCAVLFVKVNDPNYKNFKMAPAMKLCAMLVHLCQQKDPPNKLTVVIDMHGIGLMHLTTLRLGLLRSGFEYIQDALPLKIEQIHILNANHVFDKTLLLVRIFIKNELLGIIKTHRPQVGIEELHQDVPALCLPAEYGGELPSVDEIHETTVQQLREMKTFFEAEEKLIKLSQCHDHNTLTS